MKTMFKLMVNPPHSVAYRSGGYQRNETFHATWKFEDGVEISARSTADMIWYRNYAVRWSRTEYTHPRELIKKPRVYVNCPDESVFDNFANRVARPHLVWKPRVVEALKRIGVTGKLSWNIKAGCSMCPCSPGFILTGSGLPGGVDIWVTLPDVPTVADGHDEERLSRAFQLANQLQLVGGIV